MRILFVLPGLHRVDRGAEIAFISIAEELAKSGESVTLLGSGMPRASTTYRFIHAPSIARERFERFPRFPLLRGETAYEELTFLPGLLARYRPDDYDVTVTCSFPFTNVALRRPAIRGSRPPHVFVTQNGDWPAYARNSEYRLFGCEGLVCTNPDYFARNKSRWNCQLIPNGVDVARFSPGASERHQFGLPIDRPVVLMVSAAIASKRVALGIEAVHHMKEAHLIVAGDGPDRQMIEALAAQLLPGRFTRLSIPASRMPALYRSADTFLHLSMVESFGNVFVEALATGLPVVAPDNARTRWIVGDHEFLCPDDHSQAIAARLSDALRSGQAGAPARTERAKTFAWSKVAGMYREFLHKVAGI